MDVNGRRYTTCSTAGPMFVTVKDEKVLRVEPLQFDAEEADPWELVKNGKSYKPPLTQPLLPWGMAFKQINQSEDRVDYPLKRVDWDPAGERNTQNRGISGYERISWDEAYDLIESEIRRIIDTYGNSALAQSFSAHPEWGELHYFFSDWFRFWHAIGSTSLEMSPISWEGWAGGATFVWGFWAAMGFPPGTDTLQDITDSSELIILWGTDEVMHDVYNGIDKPRLWRYWKDLGKRIIVIDPFCNETAQLLADRWIPIRSGTDSAMALAILYVWITEDRYDRDFVDSHVIGFDEDHLPEGVPAGLSMVSYVMGEAADGVVKTPEWAAEICGVPASLITALAREWGTKRTSLWAEAGGACRREFAHEFSRLLAILQSAQGIGKPGVNIQAAMMSVAGPYDGFKQVGPPGYADGGMNGVLESYRPNSVNQMVQLQKLCETLEEPPLEWNGGKLFNLSKEEWWEPHVYPAPGCSEIHLMWQRGSSYGNQPNRNRHLRALRNPKIETLIVSAPWFDRDCKFADLVLPITTLFERTDLTEPGSVGQYVPPAIVVLRSAVLHQKILEPSGESKTDMEILGEIADRLGFGDFYMEGNTEEDLVRKVYEKTNIPLDYEDFKEKGYYVWPKLDEEDYVENKQMKDFYERPLENPLDTPTGLIEAFSTALYEHYGYNEEIPPVPHYIPEREGVASVETRENYPLLITAAHPKFRFHGKYNRVEWLSELYKVYGPDGCAYEPVWMNPVDAEKRHLAEGDIVRTFNDRGQVLAGLHITERLMPGVIWQSYGSWDDPLEKAEIPLDRGGNVNSLTNSNPMSVHHVAGACNSTLVEVEKADLEDIARRYPDGMDGAYSTWNRRGDK